jgi:uncharacterized phiE125 gp8 family phage protein
METITVTTPATVLPVTVANVKLSQVINATALDSLITEWIWASAERFTNGTGYVPTTTTMKMYLDHFPHGNTIYIPRTPIQSITSVKYLDTAGTWQTTTEYDADLVSVPARLVFRNTFSRPAVHATRLPVVEVTFVAGHTTGETVPYQARQFIRLLTGHWYRQREAFGEANLNEIPAGFSSIMRQFDNGILGNWNEEGVY